jgi:hypothetical protein
VHLSTTARNSGAADSSPELITYSVPVSRIHCAASNGRTPFPDTARACPPRRSHDYIRHGTVDLLAALNTATGTVIGKLSARHRAVDFRDFLGDIDRQTEPGLAIHVICDNLFRSHQAARQRATSTPDAARLLNAASRSRLC